MMRSFKNWTALSLLVLGTGFGSTPALAHGLNPAGLAPFLVDGEMVGAATNMGLVLFVDGTPTWWTELRVHGDLHWFGYTDSGRVLVATSNTLLVTEDGGCSFEGHSETFGGVDVRSMVTNPATSRPHFIATATAEASNAIFSTPDGGDTWESVNGSEIDGQYLSLRYVSIDGNYLALSTTSIPGTFSFTTLSPAGDIIETFSVAIEAADIVRLITPGSAEDVGFVAAFTRDENAEPVPLGTALPGTDNLYRVNYREGTLELVNTLTESNRFFSGAVYNGSTYVTDYDDRLLRYSDQGLEEVGDDVRYCVDDSLSLDTLWACGRRPQDYTFFNSTDAETWEGVLLFDDIAVGQCPEKVPDEPNGPGDGVDLSDDDQAGGSSGGDSDTSGDISKGDLPDTSSEADPSGAVSEKPIDESGCAASSPGLGWLLGLLWLNRRFRAFKRLISRT